MRIAVFSTPRTCSTLLCEVLAKKFDIHNHNEKLYGVYQKADRDKKVEVLTSTDNYVVKLFAKYFHNNLYIDSELFDWNIFDHVFVTQRENLVDQMASLYRMWFPKETTMLFSEEVLGWYELQNEYMQVFYKIKKQLVETHKSVIVVKHEMLQEIPYQYLNTITDMEFVERDFDVNRNKTNIEYSKYYTNYNELKNIIAQWNLMET
jgi:hypothetical protein